MDVNISDIIIIVLAIQYADGSGAGGGAGGSGAGGSGDSNEQVYFTFLDDSIEATNRVNHLDYLMVIIRRRRRRRGWKTNQIPRLPK